MSRSIYIVPAVGIGLGVVGAAFFVLQRPMAPNSEALAGASAPTTPVQLETTAAEVAAPLEHVAFTNLAGFKIPLGEPYELFVQDHPTWDCRSSTQFTLCENQAPAPVDCPAGMPCDAMVYHFQEGRLSGFSASYQVNGYWGYMLARNMQRSPASFAVLPVIGNMQTRAWRWTTSGGHLAFVLDDGYDIHGFPIRHPYRISFGPERFAPHLAGKEVSMNLPRPSELVATEAAAPARNETPLENVEDLLRAVERETTDLEGVAAE